MTLYVSPLQFWTDTKNVAIVTMELCCIANIPAKALENLESNMAAKPTLNVQTSAGISL